MPLAALGSQNEGFVKLFLPQKTFEDWMLQEKADLEDGNLVLKDPPSVHPVTSAVHFTKLVSGEDTQALVGRVKTEAQISTFGGEQMADTVIVGESAYEVVPGFIAEVQAPAPAKADPKKKASPEADLLAAFILDKL